MKLPSSFLTNTTTPAGRAEGQAINDPGGGTGTGVDEEIYNDPAYAAIAPIQSWKDGGMSDSDETNTASDMRDALEEMTDKRVTDSVGAGSLSEWDSGTTYATIGVLVTWKGFQFVSFNNTGNLSQDPLTNPDFWLPIPKPDEMLSLFADGRVLPGGMTDMVDRAGGNFRQNIAFGRYRLGGNGDDFYNFFRVMLDGTVVTGDVPLEDDIFQIGTGTQYPFADIFCPDVIGTRTLLDMGGRTTRAQSVAGKADTLGEIQEDAMQRITGAFEIRRTGTNSVTVSDPIGVFDITPTSGDNLTNLETVATLQDEDTVNFDSSDSPEAISCRTHYEQTRDALLRSHFWRFASARASLSQDSTDPAFEWDNQFILPSDFLRLKSVDDGFVSCALVSNFSYAIEGDRLLSNMDEDE